MNLVSRLQAARLTLLLDFPFFGALALRLRPVIDPSVETAQTDGITVRFNPDFCAPLADTELAWLYAHEVGHPALGHNWRLAHLFRINPEKANIAADYVVNEMLHKVITGRPGADKRLQRIPNTWLDPQFFGLSAEQIYAMLPDPPQGGKGPGQGKTVGTFVPPQPPASHPSDPSDSSDQSDPSDPSDQSDSSDLQTAWKQAAAQAATVERMKNRGELPGAIEALITELFEPKVAWQDLLRQFASTVTRDDYTWSRPNRRFAHAGIMLPTLRTESLGDIVVALDTSGSIYCDKDLLKTFLSELQGILDECHPTRITVIDCDAGVHAVTDYHPGDDLRTHRPKGGGGTRFEPVFDHVERAGDHPACLLYFTDLEGSFPDVPPDYPTLWLNYADPRDRAPFGDTVHVSNN